MSRIAILAFGSLIDEPGKEICPRIRERIFRVRDRSPVIRAVSDFTSVAYSKRCRRHRSSSRSLSRLSSSSCNILSISDSAA